MALGEDLLFSLVPTLWSLRPYTSGQAKKEGTDLNLLMASIIFFQVSQIRFMLLFGAPLSYGMLQQLHGLSDSVAGVLSELDFEPTLPWQLCSLFFTPQTPKENPMPISIPKPKIASADGGRFCSEPACVLYSNNHPLLLNKNFQSYFILSFFKLTNSSAGQMKVQLSIQKLLQAKNPVQYNLVRLSASVAERKRLNVVFYTLESTIPAIRTRTRTSQSLNPNIKS